MADQREFQARVPALDTGSALDDTDVGATKAASGLLASRPRLDRSAVVAAVALQFFILVAMILGRTMPYIGAQTVLLRVEPVDPRDLFRGDYVTLRYDIHRIRGRHYVPGRSVYVTLVPEQDGRHYRAGAFVDGPPASGLFIRGTAENYDRATYGIESFYVQEGTGHDYENAMRSHRLSAEVALDRGGNPALRRLVIE